MILLTTQFTLEGLFLGVNHHVSLEGLHLGEMFVAGFTLKGLCDAVNEHVAHHVGLLVEGPLARGTPPRFDTSMGEHVGLQVVLLEITNKSQTKKSFYLDTNSMCLRPEITISECGNVLHRQSDLIKVNWTY